MTSMQSAVKGSVFIGILLAATFTAPTMAQEIRYSYLDMSVMGQDVDRTGLQTTGPGQTVDYDATDGIGIRFRGSVGTWHNLYMFVDYSSTDIDVSALITNQDLVNPQNPPFETTAADEFDLTTIRGGIGLKYSVNNNLDAYVEASYDSADLDFGSFALENFDTGEKGFGGALGARYMLNDDVELRGWGRYTSVGDVHLNGRFFEDDTLFGVGFGWEVVRGFSIVGDIESGEFSNWSLGFRLDLDEN